MSEVKKPTTLILLGATRNHLTIMLIMHISYYRGSNKMLIIYSNYKSLYTMFELNLIRKNPKLELSLTGFDNYLSLKKSIS